MPIHNQNHLEQVIQSIVHNMELHTKDVAALKGINPAQSPEHYNKKAVAAALQGERITRRLRSLVNDVVSPSVAREYTGKVGNELGIEVNIVNDGSIVITMPGLLLHRSKADLGYITKPLSAVLSELVTGNPQFVRLEHCDISIVQTYDTQIFKTRTMRSCVRDYDNLELASILNVINIHLLTDDSGYYCNMHLYSEFSDIDMTTVKISKREATQKNPIET